MTQKDVAAYYGALSRGDKGRFTAFVSLRLGGSPHSRQHRLLCVARDTAIRPLSPVIDVFLFDHVYSILNYFY